MENPTISVLMPVYNTEANHLHESIESILSQTFEDFEFLVLNDASSNDQVEKIILSYTDPRIRYIRNDKNLGISGARNYLLQEARGKYIAIMDHDDISMPTRFEKQVWFLDTHPSVGVVGSYVYFFLTNQTFCVPTSDIDIRTDLMQTCSIVHPSAMLRKELLVKTKIQYERQFTPSEDYALWCRLLPYTKFANIPEILLHYRSHDKSVSKTQQKQMRMISAQINTWVQNENPTLWKRYQMPKEPFYTQIKIRLFCFIPIWKIEQREQNRIHYLLNLIPIIKIKKGSDLQYPKSSFIIGNNL